MKKKLVLLCISTVVSLLSIAQNPGWIFPPKFIPDVGNPQLEPLPGYSGGSFTGSNMQLDSEGNILFFVIGTEVSLHVYDKDGSFIGDLDGELFSPNYCVNGFQGSELTIIPDPSNCLKYYIISNTYSQANCGNHLVGNALVYATLDFSEPRPHAPSKMGKLSDVQFLEVFDTPWISPNLFGTLFATSTIRSSTNGDSRYLFITHNYTYNNLSKGIARFKIDNTGINYDGIIPYQNASNISNTGVRAEMELIDLPNGHFRIAVPYLTNISHNSKAVLSCVYIAELDATGQVYNNQEELLYFYKSTNSQEDPYVHGLEFSPDGSKLFISHVASQYHPNSLEYYDFSNPNLSDPNGNGIYPLNIGTANNADFQFSQIEYAVDQKMYFGVEGRLASLNNPNNPSTSTFVDNEIMISGYTASLGPWSETKLYQLPDQIDGMDYKDFFEVSLTCCIDTRSYQISKYTADNSTWNGTLNPVAPGSSTIYIKEELRIPAGKTVTIQNMTLKFAPGARLIIENGVGSGQGGKLRIMNNTVLTIDDRCSSEEMWLGVEVWGNSTAAQGNYSNSTQGVFRMYGNSRIEHAYVGVLASRRNESSGVPLTNSYNSSRNGAIVIVENSTFKNCQYSALFQPYTIGSTNVSYFRSTNFVWDGLLLNPSLKPGAHLGLVQCSDVRVTTSNFYQNTPNLYANKSDWGIGILAFNSGFTVNTACSVVQPLGVDCPDANVIPSRFKNLSTGVMVTNPNHKPFTVLRNEFENCLAGVTSASSHVQNISRNKFYIYEDDLLQTWGIFVSNGTGYRIEENYLASMSGRPAITYGIIIDNSGTAHNKVYKNTFEKLYVGTEAQRINGKLLGQINDGASGLQYICNDFRDTELTDIGVNGRIDIEQGLVGGTTLNQARNRAAKNTFSMFGENQTTFPDHDIMLYPGTQHINYVHLNATTHIPDNYTQNGATQVFVQQQLFGGNPVGTSDGMCPTYFVTFVMGVKPVKGKLLKIDSLYNIIDGGKQEYLLNLISSAPTATATRNELSSYSPYLSDEVLEAYILSSASNSNVKTVLTQNSKLSDYIMNVLKYQSSRPSNLLTGALLNDFSARKTLLNTIKLEEMELHQIQQQILSELITDTLVVNQSDSLVKYLELFRGTDFKKSLLAHYSSVQNKVKFDSLLLTLAPEITMDLADFYAIRYQIDEHASVWDAVEQDSSLSVELMNIFLNATDYEAIANANLYLSVLKGGLPYCDILPLIGSSGMIVQQSEEGIESDEAILNSIKLYPNPSEGIVYYDFSGFESKTVKIQLFDITGKEVFSKDFYHSNGERVDLSHIKKGTYITRVTIDEQTTKAQLLILE